jgi:hypothetical protein
MAWVKALPLNLGQGFSTPVGMGRIAIHFVGVYVRAAMPLPNNSIEGLAGTLARVVPFLCDVVKKSPVVFHILAPNATENRRRNFEFRFGRLLSYRSAK